jgi:gliding motility-associated-like protein
LRIKVYILFFLLGLSALAVSQTTPAVCTESWVRYAAIQDSTIFRIDKSHFNWVIQGEYLNKKEYVSGDSIDIQWGKVPGYSRLGVSEFTSHGCLSDTAWTTIEVKGTIISLGDDIEKCFNQPFNFTVRKGYASYSWNGGKKDSVTNTFSGIATKTDTIVVVAVNKTGCENSDTAIVIVHDLPKFDITSGGVIVNDTAICGDEFKLVLDAGYNGQFYKWGSSDENSFVNGSTSSTISVDPIQPMSKIQSQKIWVTVTNNATSDFEGCESTDTIHLIKCTPPSKNSFSKAFTPNGDGENDEWDLPELVYFPKAIIDVYDRWGRLVYHIENGYQKKWDGRSNGVEVPMDNYFYVIRLTKDSKPIVGNVMIIR